MKRKLTLVLLFSAFALSTSFSLYMWYTPAHYLTPTWFGVSCSQTGACFENRAQKKQFDTNFEQALTTLETQLVSIRPLPMRVVCESDTCADYFGVTQHATVYGTRWMAFGPKQRSVSAIRRALVLYWQNKHFGSSTVKNAPGWLREGMADAISLVHERDLDLAAKGNRQRYEKWYINLDKSHFLEHYAQALEQ